MRKDATIIIIDDDPDDQETIIELYQEIDPLLKVMAFNDSQKAYDFLSTSGFKPLFVLSDINLPKLSGIELRKKISESENWENNCIPYIFLTTGTTDKAMKDICTRNHHGIFYKPTSYNAFRQLLQTILFYWKNSEASTSIVF